MPHLWSFCCAVHTTGQFLWYYSRSCWLILKKPFAVKSFGMLKFGDLLALVLALFWLFFFGCQPPFDSSHPSTARASLSIMGASTCVPMLLKCAASPLRLVLGKESFHLLVDTPLVPFVRYSGGKRELLQRELNWMCYSGG